MKQNIQSIQAKINQKLPLLILSVGIFFRFVEYVANRSFWFDEATRALEFINNSLFSLLQIGGFEKTQVCASPYGFLVIEKILTMGFGTHEMVFRLFPFACGVASLFIFYKIARELLNQRAALLAFFLFSVSPVLIFYSSELKPYASDVLIALLLYGMFLKTCAKEKLSTGSVFLFGFLGAAAIWFSLPSVFILMGAGSCLFLNCLYKKNFNKGICRGLMLFLWAVSFALYYLTSLRYFSNDQSLVHYWVSSYLPLGSHPVEVLKWIAECFSQVFVENFQYPVWVAGFTFLFGAIAFCRKSRDFFWILVAPLIGVLIASGLKVYPFSGRVLLFLSPAFIFLIAEGVEQICQNKSGFNEKVLRVVFIVSLGFYPLIFSVSQFLEPFGPDEIKPVMQYISQNKEEGDTIYLYYASYPGFKYYSNRYGFGDDEYIAGVSSKENAANYIKDIDKLRGQKRVWFVFSHVYIKGGINERIFITEHLKAMGKIVDFYAVKSRPSSSPIYCESDISAAVYLYDLRG